MTHPVFNRRIYFFVTLKRYISSLGYRMRLETKKSVAIFDQPTVSKKISNFPDKSWAKQYAR